MMRSLILRTGATVALPLLLLFSVVLLLRGHNEPGGGFVGGLLAAAAFAVYALAFSVAQARSVLRADPLALVAVGLALSLGSGLVGIVTGAAPFDAWWPPLPTLGEVKLGTVLLFDVGVYFTVLGITLLMIFSLSER